MNTDYYISYAIESFKRKRRLIPSQVLEEFKLVIEQHDLKKTEFYLERYPLLVFCFLDPIRRRTALMIAIDANAYMVVYLLLIHGALPSVLTQKQKDYLSNLQENIEGKVHKYLFDEGVMQTNPLYLEGTVGLDTLPSFRIN